MELDQQSPDNTSHALRARLVRYLFGEATADDRIDIEQRLTNDPDFKKVIESVQNWWHMQGTASASHGLTDAELAESQAAWASVASKTGIHGQQGIKNQSFSLAENKERRFLRHLLRSWTWAASVALALIMVGVLWRFNRQPSTGITKTYTTTSGQQATVTLDDSTRITLAPNTTLRLLSFGAGSRTVSLDGEAYFSVAHASGLPFVVHSGDATVQVLGTAFHIRHMPWTKDVRVAVADGKVLLTPRSGNRSSATLIAGQIGEVTDSTVRVNAIEDFAPGTEWTHDQLRFRDIPLSVVLATVSRWYGYQFRCADSTFSRQTVTLGISIRSSAEALAEIERVLSVNLSVVGDTVTLIPHAPKQDSGASRIRTYDVWTPTHEVGR